MYLPHVPTVSADVVLLAGGSEAAASAAFSRASARTGRDVEIGTDVLLEHTDYVGTGC
jgi:hypothetical protein